MCNIIKINKKPCIECIEVIEQSEIDNHDGSGLIRNGKLAKILDNQEFCGEKSLVEALINYEFQKGDVIHFRYRSHGERSLEMVHPFLTADGNLLMHNGVLNYENAVKSDTKRLSEIINEDNYDFILNNLNGKYAYVDTKDGKVRLYGTFTKSDCGCISVSAEYSLFYNKRIFSEYEKYGW